MIKSDNGQPLASFKFNLYYTKEKIEKIKKFTVRQNNLPYPIVDVHKWNELNQHYIVEFSIEINKQDMINVLDFYENSRGKNNDYSTIFLKRTSLKDFNN